MEKGSQKYSLDLYKLIEREGNRFIVQDAEGDNLRRKLKPSEIQVIKKVDNKIDRNIIKEQAAEKKQRQVINKLVRGAEMKGKKALKAIESLKTNNSSPAFNTRSRKKNYLNSQLFILLKQFSNLSSYGM